MLRLQSYPYNKIATKLPPQMSHAKFVSFCIIADIALITIFYICILLSQIYELNLFVQLFGSVIAILIILTTGQMYYDQYHNFNIKSFIKFGADGLITVIPCLAGVFHIQLITLSCIIVEIVILILDREPFSKQIKQNTIIILVVNAILVPILLHLDHIFEVPSMILTFVPFVLFIICLVGIGLLIKKWRNVKDNDYKEQLNTIFQITCLITIDLGLSLPVYWGYISRNIIIHLSFVSVCLLFIITVLVYYLQEFTVIYCYYLDEEQRNKNKIIYRISQNWFSNNQPEKQMRQKLRQTNYQIQFCCICTTNPANIVWFPCGHNNLCADCSMKLFQLNQRQCSLCKKQMKQVYEFIIDEQEKGAYQNLKFMLPASLQSYEFRIKTVLTRSLVKKQHQ